MVTRTWAAGAAHRGQLAAAQGPAGEGDQRVAHPLAVAAQVAGRAVAVHHRLQRGVHGLPADRVQVPGQVDPAVGADRHPEDPRQPGRVVQGAVGVDRRPPTGATAFAVSSGPSVRAARR